MHSVSVWERLAPLTESSPEDPADDDVAPEDGPTPKKFWRRVHMLDAVALPCWVYVTSKLLVDWDSALVRAIDPGLAWIVNFRILVFAILLLGLAWLGRKMFPLWLAYLALWPLLLVTWRIPWALYRRGRWNHIVGLVHIIVGGLAGIRSGLSGLVLGIGPLLLLALPGTITAWLALAATALFEAWLLIAACRAGLRPSRFLTQP